MSKAQMNGRQITVYIGVHVGWLLLVTTLDCVVLL